MKAMSKHKAIAGLTALAVAILAGTGAAAAQSLKEVRAREAEEKALEREVAYTRSVCGNALSGAIDWRSAADWPQDASLAGACDGALGALEAACRKKDGKAKARRITRFICAGDGAGASLSGGALRYGARPETSGFAETKALLDREF